MFEFFFKYPMTVFTKGRLVLLASWPAWVLVVLIVTAVIGLGWLIWWRLQRLEPVKDVTPQMQRRRAAAIWAMQSAVVVLVLLLLWQPAVVVAELKSQQNIIAVLVDDSRSMGIADSGTDQKSARETAAWNALQGACWRGFRSAFRHGYIGWMRG